MIQEVENQIKKQDNEKTELPEFEAKVYGTEDLKSFFALAHILVENLTMHIVKEDSNCSYSLEYIRAFLNSVSNSVMVEFSTKMPMRMTTTFRNNSRVHFYLAPYVRNS